VTAVFVNSEDAKQGFEGNVDESMDGFLIKNDEEALLKIEDLADMTAED
jgi:hypothetical protein